MKKKIFFENLDGLRFLCFLSVFFFHSFHTDIYEIKTNILYRTVKVGFFSNGNLGVNFFFVLSGFLITYLLIEEKRLNKNIDLRKFWIRRALRIWPLFYFCVFFGFFIFPILKQYFGQFPNETAHLSCYLTFTNNFDFIKSGLPDASILGVLWSIAVEEQFYLVWPIVLYIFPIRLYWLPFSLIISISLIFRFYNDSYLMHEYHTLSCIGDMAIGAFGAWLMMVSGAFKNKIIGLKKYQIGLVYLTFAIIFFLRNEFLYSIFIFRPFERILIAIIILMIILEQSYSQNSFFKMSKFKLISRLGLITYGLYCLQFVGILSATTITRKLAMNTKLWQVLILETSLALALTIIFGLISFKYFEKPFLNLKKRYSYITKQ